MVEIIFVLLASIFGFLLLFLAFILKNRPGNESTQIPTCHACNCHKKVLLEKEKTHVLKTLMSRAKGESAMGYQEIQRKLNAVKRRLQELHQPLKKIADENYEYYSSALAMHEDLIGPEMDASEMFYIEGELDALERKLSKYH